MVFEMGTHVKRWITGLVAVPIVIAIVLGPEQLLAFFIAFVAAGALHEYNSMVFSKGLYWEKSECLVMGTLMPLAAYWGGINLLFAVVAFSIIIIFLLFLYRVNEASIDISELVKVIFGLIYIPMMISYIVILRNHKNGLLWVFFLIVLAFSSDIAAFYVGKTQGKRKLIPNVSAGKTVEGALGSVAGSLAGGIIFKLLFFHELPFIHAAILGLMSGILGQLGDLSESVIKRTYMVKDSGELLPGHGGILDRLDSFIFIIPFVYYYNVFVIIR